jgi:hypothetical protein
MADDYRDVLGGSVDPTVALDLTSPLIRDATTAFQHIPERGRPFLCSVDDTFFTGPRRERYRDVANPGLNRSDSHLQGIQRFRDRLYLSAGDLMEGRPHLFILRYDDASPEQPATAELTGVVTLDDRRDHAGGIQRLGDVLAVAIEGHRIGSVVAFLHLADPDRPRWIPGARIERDDPKAGAAALAVLRGAGGDRAGDRVLVGVAWAKPGPLFGLLGRSRAFLDLYLSREADLHQGFEPEFVRVDVSRLTKKAPEWQAIAFLPTAATREVVLIGTRSSSRAPGGSADADLCRIRFGDDPAAAWPNVDATPEHLATRTFRFDRDFGDFAAAAGIDCVSEDRITLFATGHFRFTDGFRLSVCGSAPAPVT